jgi:hypothetical protein
VGADDRHLVGRAHAPGGNVAEACVHPLGDGLAEQRAPLDGGQRAPRNPSGCAESMNSSSSGPGLGSVAVRLRTMTCATWAWWPRCQPIALDSSCGLQTTSSGVRSRQRSSVWREHGRTPPGAR